MQTTLNSQVELKEGLPIGQQARGKYFIRCRSVTNFIVVSIYNLKSNKVLNKEK